MYKQLYLPNFNRYQKNSIQWGDVCIFRFIFTLFTFVRFLKKCKFKVGKLNEKFSFSTFKIQKE